MTLNPVGGSPPYTGPVRPNEQTPPDSPGIDRTASDETGDSRRSAVRDPSAEAGGRDAPEGTDPELWAALSDEEQAYFSRLRSSGALSYGPAGGSTRSEPAPVGGRLDVRV